MTAPPHSLHTLTNELTSKVMQFRNTRRFVFIYSSLARRYVANARRKFDGLAYAAPEFRPWLGIEERACGGVPAALMMAWPRCRVATTAEEKKAWRAAAGVHAQVTEFHPLRRFVAVMIMMMYGLFPTLVASTASIFKCTASVEGRRYLYADMTQECYTGVHLWYIVAAALAVAVYCIGTPIILATTLTFEMCSCNAPTWGREGAGMNRTPATPRVVYKPCRCICAMRSRTPWGFQVPSFRERFSLLVTGYSTERGALIMAWEPLVVMLRKLFITLAGSVANDAYVQIMIALAILVTSLTLQGAFVYSSPARPSVWSRACHVQATALALRRPYLPSTPLRATPSRPHPSARSPPSTRPPIRVDTPQRPRRRFAARPCLHADPLHLLSLPRQPPKCTPPRPRSQNSRDRNHGTSLRCQHFSHRSASRCVDRAPRV